MNDDDYWNILRPSLSKDWDFTYQQARQMDSSLTTQQIYDLLIQIDQYSKKDTEMAYSYSRGYYNNTRGDEVATAVLEAYANGVEFETLIRKNSAIRQYYYQIQSEKAAKEKARQREQERLRKLQEKRAIERAKKEEVMAKLTPEELEAFGFKKGRK